MTPHNKQTEQKNLLLLKGEALRLQLALEVLESKQSLKPLRLAQTMLSSTKTLTLLGTFFAGRRKSTRLPLILALTGIFLWTKKKLR